MSTDNEIPEHAENSPSSSEGWVNCPDYINANRGLPDVQSWEAAEGTAAHHVSNECLTMGIDAESYIGTTQQVGRWSFTWEDDDAMLLQPGIDWLRDMGANEGRFYGEHRVDITESVGFDSLGRRQYGTLDRGLITPEMIIISDLKWGRGVPVYAKNCLQIAIYGLNFWRNIARHETKVTQFLLHIDQPRHMGGGGKWFVTLDDLLDLDEKIRAAAEATRAPNPPRNASMKGCLWCRRKIARGGCAEFERYLFDLLGLTPDDIDNGKIVMPEGLTPERRATLLLHRPMIEKWLEQMYDQALADAVDGQPVGPMKAVHGQKKRDAWLDAEAAKKAVTGVLGEKSFTQKLITPTQASKKIPSDSFDWLAVEPLIKRGERSVVLVPEEDERDAIVTAAQLRDLEDL